jgi:hypothetical protein
MKGKAQLKHWRAAASGCLSSISLTLEHWGRRGEDPISTDDDARRQEEEGQGRRGGDGSSSSAYSRSPREGDEEESFFLATWRGCRREAAGVPDRGARSRGALPLLPRGHRRGSSSLTWTRTSNGAPYRRRPCSRAASTRWSTATRRRSASRPTPWSAPTSRSPCSKDKGTCAFDVDARKWEMVDDSNLPFVGQAVPLGGHRFVACSRARGGAAAVYRLEVSRQDPPSPRERRSCQSLSCR